MPSSSSILPIKDERSSSPLFNDSGLRYRSVTPDFQSQRDVEKYRKLREEERRRCLVSSGSNIQNTQVNGKHTGKEKENQSCVEDSDPGTRSNSPPIPSQRDTVRHRELRDEELVPSGSNIQNNGALKRTEMKRSDLEIQNIF
ncbi:hypothetical protein AGABI2DRAFT_116532 [Agaricus bisporus var. bisporus H97]|uniref:hypothetical protein n=1 Tax=Agaricus bisporus var. bisporus (strain H97 / ATCC MYA-4626 / FGSC 10389) TaxID=936046 RepID=UPI00029F6FAB|nr:hypothetical protein AGABI2DRAFT_116532 [Agaricus bisporus var. bisporus H97]EKV49496.1 hypothetical protein AGABI2DRAFT_116532 [Agaricus bisporus var. bisporus H97]